LCLDRLNDGKIGSKQNLDKSPLLTDKEKELLKAPGILAKLERQAAMMDKE
jgi:hypothetical protein